MSTPKLAGWCHKCNAAFHSWRAFKTHMKKCRKHICGLNENVIEIGAESSKFQCKICKKIRTDNYFSTPKMKAEVTRSEKEEVSKLASRFFIRHRLGDFLEKDYYILALSRLMFRSKKVFDRRV